VAIGLVLPGSERAGGSCQDPCKGKRVKGSAS
jgi:hypothetical protein